MIRKIKQKKNSWHDNIYNVLHMLPHLAATHVVVLLLERNGQYIQEYCPFHRGNNVISFNQGERVIKGKVIFVCCTRSQK